jgi:hypothetical protein
MMEPGGLAIRVIPLKFEQSKGRKLTVCATLAAVTLETEVAEEH